LKGITKMMEKQMHSKEHQSHTAVSDVRTGFSENLLHQDWAATL